MSAARELLRALDARAPVEMRVLVLAAHPDDETIGMGASLALCRDLTIVHVTDGAPRDGADARSVGFATTQEYAAARRAELAAALRAGEVRARMEQLGVADQRAAFEMSRLIDWLADLLRRVRPACVVTHAYEGGHPDHDTACLVARLACHAQQETPGLLEMTGYFANPTGEMIVGGFLGEPAALVATLTEEERARREAMLDCFVSQRATLAPFRGAETECFRLSPPYDFGAAPNPGRLWYERFDWGITGEQWRGLAREALDACLG